MNCRARRPAATHGGKAAPKGDRNPIRKTVPFTKQKPVRYNSIWSVCKMPEELNYAVYLSYEDLSPYMKQCFLHYSLLPKNTVFLDTDIVGMWISEGFLDNHLGELEELGSKYYKEMIWRNLIEPDPKYVGQRVCNMHDVVRSFAQYVARDEALAAHGEEIGIISKLSSQECLRLSLVSKTSESNDLEWSSLQAHKSLRTLISIGPIKIKPGDSLIAFSCLRTLHIRSANVAALVDSLYRLNYLRYLAIQKTSVARLPENIDRLKFLQFISLAACHSLVKLPDSIVKLGQLRHLYLRGTSINGIPRGFCVLTNLRILLGFPADVEGDWCSLEELGPLSQLRNLGLQGLENVSTNLSAAKARLGEKVHLTKLRLDCGSILGDDGLIKEEEGVFEEVQRRIEEVFDELSQGYFGQHSLEYLFIEGYFGQRLPRWMMSTSTSSLWSLRILGMENLACCTQLPDGS